MLLHPVSQVSLIIRKFSIKENPSPSQMAKKEEPGFMFFQEEWFDWLTNLIQGAKPVYKVPKLVH